MIFLVVSGFILALNIGEALSDQLFHQSGRLLLEKCTIEAAVNSV